MKHTTTLIQVCISTDKGWKKSVNMDFDIKSKKGEQTGLRGQLKVQAVKGR